MGKWKGKRENEGRGIGEKDHGRRKIGQSSFLTMFDSKISFRKNSAEKTRNGFRYSAEESAPWHSKVYGRVNSEARNETE